MAAKRHAAIQQIRRYFAAAAYRCRCLREKRHAIQTLHRRRLADDVTRPRNHMTLQHSERIRRLPSRHGDLFVQGTEVEYRAEGASVGRYCMIYCADILAIGRHLPCDLDLLPFDLEHFSVSTVT